MMRKYRNKNTPANILAVEETLNFLRYHPASNVLKQRTTFPDFHDSWSEEQHDRIEALLSEMQEKVHDPKKRPDIIFVETRMTDLGYVKKDRNPDYARFQMDAMISQSVWSRYYNGTDVRTSHDTFLKIVIGLRLNQQLAETYLRMVGDGLRLTDRRDQIILAVIRNFYMGETEIEHIIEALQDVLDFYSREEEKKGNKPFPKLYDI